MKKRIPVSVGLDYHQYPVQVCVMNESGETLVNQPCENNWKTIREVAEHKGRVRRVAIEACSGAADLAEELIQQAGWRVQLAHPGFVSRMKQNPDKHDWGDARMLADLVRVGYLPTVWLAPQETRDLRRLVRYRQQLIEERRRGKLRIRGILRDNRARCTLARPWTRAWWAWTRQAEEISKTSLWIIEQWRSRVEALTVQVREVEKELERMTHEDAVVRRLRDLPGIGPVTAWMLRAEVGRFDRFATGKQLARFCGVTPRNASSGCRQADAGLIKAGNPQLRAILMQAAHRLIRQPGEWADLGARLLKAGKPKNVVVAAVANRWVRWLFHQMQSEK